MAPHQEIIVFALLSLARLISGAPSSTPTPEPVEETDDFVVVPTWGTQHECVTAILTEVAVNLNLTQSCYDRRCICEPSIFDQTPQIITDAAPRVAEKGFACNDKFSEHAAHAQDVLDVFCQDHNNYEDGPSRVLREWSNLLLLTTTTTQNWTAVTEWSKAFLAESTTATLSFVRHPRQQLRECWRDRLGCRRRLVSVATSPTIQLPIFLAIGGPILAFALLTRLRSRSHGRGGRAVFHVGQFVYATRRALVANYLVFGVSYLVSTYYISPFCCGGGNMRRPPREFGTEAWFLFVAVAWFVVELVACCRRWFIWRSQNKEGAAEEDVMLPKYGKVYVLEESHC